MTATTDAALRALLIRFGGKLRAEISRHRLDQYGVDVQDVEQEVRIRLWKTLQRDPNTPLPASYIQRTVLSVLVDSVRRAQARPPEAATEAEASFDRVETGEVSPEREAASWQLAEQVHRCIANLPERRQRPLQLYLQGFSLAEVADLCDLTFDAGRKLIYRGLDELKQQLRDAGLEPDDD